MFGDTSLEVRFNRIVFFCSRYAQDASSGVIPIFLPKNTRGKLSRSIVVGPHPEMGKLLHTLGRNVRRFCQQH